MRLQEDDKVKEKVKQNPWVTRNIYFTETLDQRLNRAIAKAKKEDRVLDKEDRLKLNRSVVCRLALADWLDEFEAEFK